MTFQLLVGDLRCPDVDVDAWKEENRIPLFPNKTNRWLVARLNESNETKDDVTIEIYRAFSTWFDTTIDILAATESRARFGPADNVQVEFLPNDTMLTTSKLGKKREELAKFPTLGGNDVQYLLITFDYRGAANDMAWPVYSKGLAAAWCPIDADILVLATIADTELTESPIERGDDTILGDIGEVIGDKLMIVGGILLLTLAVTAGVYAGVKSKL